MYSVTVAFAGFTSRPADNIRLALGEALVLDFELEIAARPEEITVVAEPLLGASRLGSVATVVSQREIESLPTNGRNFIAFSLITPGVNGDRTPQQGVSASSGLTLAQPDVLLRVCRAPARPGHKRSGARYRFLAVYTLSKAEDMATDIAFSQPQENGSGRNPADPTGLPLGFDPDSERGPSLQDQRHRFVLSGDYRLPGSITVSGVVMLGSGRPYNITAGSDLNHDGAVGNDRPWRVTGNLATRIGRNKGLLPATATVDVHVAKRLVRGRHANRRARRPQHRCSES